MKKSVRVPSLICLAFLLLAISRVTAQTLTHRIDTVSAWGGQVAAFQRVGDIGYCGSGQRLVVLDMINEANVHEISSLSLDSEVNAIVVRGAYAYVGTGGYPTRLAVVNVANPSTPHLISVEGGPFAVTVGSIKKAWAYSDILYVCDGGGNVGAYNLTDPAHPILARQRVSELGSTVDMQIVGSLAYVAHVHGLLQIFSLVDPIFPTLLGSIQITGAACTEPITSVSVQGNRALVQARDGCRSTEHPYFARLVDITNPTNPVPLGEVYDQFVTADRSALYGNYALVADWASAEPCGISLNEKGLAIIDFSNPASPVLVSTYRTNWSSIRDVRIQGDRAYLFCDGQGLEVIDLSNLQQLRRAGGYFSPSHVRDCWKDGNRLYVSDEWNGFTVLDVSNPNVTPAVLGVYRTPETDRQGHGNVVVRGGLAYLAGGWSGVHIVDVSNPPSMVEAGPGIPGPQAISNIVRIDIDRTVLHASVASKPSCCNICTTLSYRNYDISNPWAPTEVGWCPVGSLPRDMVSKGDITFYFRGTYDIDLYDNVTPVPPSYFSHVDGGSYDAALDGNTLLASLHDTLTPNPRAYIFDVTDPRNPVQRGFIDGRSYGAGVALQGNRAYFCANRYDWPQFIGSNYTMAFDISNPAAPQLLGYSFAQPARILADGDYLYTLFGENYGLGNQGLVIQRYRCAADMDDNGVRNVNDFVAFLNAYAAVDFRADIDRNRVFNVNDFVGYLNLYAAGCD